MLLKLPWMTSAYYKDLLLLRCRIAEVFSELTQSASTVVSTDSSLPMELSADVHGFGPTFRITINIVSSAKSNVFNLYISSICDPTLYEFENPLIRAVSFIAPGHKYTFTTLLTCKDPEKATKEEIRILLGQENGKIIATTAINMPMSEFPID
ncbi:unnamed protein product [Caenorhabditis angaria]|uniref:Bardet-Biedl syndrome 1 protein GAE domain-containing protein n=1 Tax=Caenorhabditis angaria TaxID=860376 RepID=A0A9P1I600_9PELO|nr:unnamed protein product [Caenorhabditis angaria]